MFFVVGPAKAPLPTWAHATTVIYSPRACCFGNTHKQFSTFRSDHALRPEAGSTAQKSFEADHLSPPPPPHCFDHAGPRNRPRQHGVNRQHVLRPKSVAAGGGHDQDEPVGEVNGRLEPETNPWCLPVAILRILGYQGFAMHTTLWNSAVDMPEWSKIFPE